jgi:putative tryptophan/tyrosine transport system substrate-binding protein
MRRRDVLAMLGGAAAASALARNAHSIERVRRIGVFVGPGTGPQTQAGVVVFRERLQELGWVEGVNARFEVRWSNSDFKLMRVHAAELVALAPDVILVQSNPALAALRLEDRTIPTVFVHVADPVGSGFIESLARPGGNVTGFTNFEPSMGGKWLELLREIAPAVDRVLVILHPETTAHTAFWQAAEALARKIGVAPIRGVVHDGGEIERALAALASEPNGGVIVLPHTITEVHRDLIINRAAQDRLPTIYAFGQHCESGGLVSYGINLDEPLRRAAPYVDRILRGTNPSELPVQAPIKFELVINLTTAQALGLTVPRSLLARADELIK